MARRETTRGMSDRHEADLVEWFGGSLMPGSGNQWNRPMDGRHSRYTEKMAFAWDGKSTMGKSILITRDMVDKAIEQAGAERPLIALRWYNNMRLTDSVDWVALSAHDFAELLAAANEA